MYVRYGFFREALVSVIRKGKEGQEEIAKMMSDYRSDPPRSLGGSPIVVIKDYLNGEALDLTNGSKTPIDMERSNVLQFTTADSTVVSIRPSGTEPKIKFYFGVRAELNASARYRPSSTARSNRSKRKWDWFDPSNIKLPLRNHGNHLYPNRPRRNPELQGSRG